MTSLRAQLAESVSDSGLVAGVDGVRGGWAMAITGVDDRSPVEFSVWSSLEELWAEAQASGLLVVSLDMPVGLPGRQRRTADIEARELLGRRRASLFWTPPLCVIDATDHAEANQRSRDLTDRGISAQTFNLMPKIRDLRATLAPEDFAPAAVPRAAEVHPESSFVRLAGAPMTAPKSELDGIQERLAALVDVFPNISEAASSTPPLGPPKPALDDLLDAAAAAWTSRRIVTGQAECLGAGEEDETGYPMHIWV